MSTLGWEPTKIDQGSTGNLRATYVKNNKSLIITILAVSEEENLILVIFDPAQ
jgi:hypothetical protein